MPSQNNRRPSGPPYLGAAYYPEDWPIEQVDEDIALMKEAGMNVMRIGEFAWSRMEPKEGEYDFEWLHLVISKLAEAGISTIFGTPTCTPPLWLSEKHPEILFVNGAGKRASHGGRRHACPNNPVYRDYCSRIVTRMGEEFGQDDRVIGWQIDNEVYPQDRACCCPVCVEKFAEYMQERYGTIERLNEAWCTNLWSQTYSSFDQLPTPGSFAWHHPSLLAAWEEFNSRSYIDFVDHQADVLHRLTKQPVGTDIMPLGGIDHYDINRKLDVVQFNHYNNSENLWYSCFWFDFLRQAREVPFWNTETATCWGGGTAIAGYNEEGFCKVNSWLPIALGGEANLYWLWRTHWAGQELMHGSVLATSGRPMHIFGEVQEVARGYRKAGDFINGTSPDKSGLAVHFSNSAYITFKNQPMINGFDYYSQMMNSVYRPLIRAQYRPDIIDPSVDLSAYRLILTPFLPALEEAGLIERIKAWVADGGTWVVGPMSDVRTLGGTKFMHAPFGFIEQLGGVYCRYQLPGDPRSFKIQWNDGSQMKSSLWYDILEPRGAGALATYKEGPGKGLAAITIRMVGKGRVVVLGTLPSPEDLMRLLTRLGNECEVIPSAQASENLMVVPRSGITGTGAIVVETDNKLASITLDRTATDLLTGKTHSGRVDMMPYTVMVLKYAD